MKYKLIGATLGVALGLLFFGRVSADPPQCGPISKWNGKVCIGPRGKAYCPADMTMNGDTCLAAASSGAPAATPFAKLSSDPDVARPLPDTDHARIIQMLTALTNQVTQQGAVINDLQQKLIAMQIVLNLTTTNLDKAKTAALNAEAGVAGIQASTASLANNVSSLQAGSTALAGKVSTVQTQVTAVQNAQSAEQASITDVSKRLLLTCLIVTGSYNGIDGRDLHKNACTSTWWAPGAWNFSIPFGN